MCFTILNLFENSSYKDIMKVKVTWKLFDTFLDMVYAQKLVLILFN